MFPLLRRQGGPRQQMIHHERHLKIIITRGDWLVILISKNKFIWTTLGVEHVVLLNNISIYIHRCPVQTTEALASE